MPSHSDPDDLALRALGETPADHPAGHHDPDDDHLAGCGQCQSELDQLRAVVATARSVTAEDYPQAPPARVWDRIAAEVGMDTAQPVTQLPSRHRRVPVALVAAAAALLGLIAGVAATVVAIDSGDSSGSGTVLARTELTPLPDHVGRGDAEVLRDDDGRLLELAVSGLPPAEGFYQVWLLDSAGTAMVPVGLLGDQDRERFVLPAGVDISAFPVVDVSLEPDDGDPAHSGDSVVRGTLTG